MHLVVLIVLRTLDFFSYLCLQCNFFKEIAFYFPDIQLMKNLKTVLLYLTILFSLNTYAQRGKENIVSDNAKRKFTKTEVRFMSSNIDSIKFNLNRMIIFEKELKQRNFYINEKTALVDELVSIVEQLKKSIDVVNIETSDIKNIFGKASFKSPKIWVYEIETYKSNCPFIQITFNIQQTAISKIEYKITDCQKWK